MAEAFLAGLIGFLIGRGIEPKDATAIVEALRTYLGFEPPLGLAGYALQDIVAGQEANAAVVVRGRAYDVVALEQIPRHSQVSVLGRKGERLEVAPTIEALKITQTVQAVNIIKAVESYGFSMKEANYIMNGQFATGDLSWWQTSQYVKLVTDGLHGRYYVENAWSGGVGVPDLRQFILSAPPSDNMKLVFRSRKTVMTDAKARAFIGYTDDTQTAQSFDLSMAWETYKLSADAAKEIEWAGLCNDSSVGTVGTVYYADILLLRP